MSDIQGIDNDVHYVTIKLEMWVLNACLEQKIVEYYSAIALSSSLRPNFHEENYNSR